MSTAVVVGGDTVRTREVLGRCRVAVFTRVGSLVVSLWAVASHHDRVTCRHFLAWQFFWNAEGQALCVYTAACWRL